MHPPQLIRTSLYRTVYVMFHVIIHLVLQYWHPWFAGLILRIGGHTGGLGSIMLRRQNDEEARVTSNGIYCFGLVGKMQKQQLLISAWGQLCERPSHMKGLDRLLKKTRALRMCDKFGEMSQLSVYLYVIV